MSYNNWSPSDVCDQLADLGLSQYSDEFERNDISGEVLPFLTDIHLKEMGVRQVGDRLKIMKFIRTTVSGGFSARPSTSSRGRAPEPEPYQAPKARAKPPAAPEPDPYEQPRAAVKRQPQPDPYDDPPPSKPATSWEAKRKQMHKKPVMDDYDDPAPPPAARPKPAAKPKPVAAKAKAPPPPPPSDDPNDDRVPCSYCGRRFASDRIDAHERACSAMASRKTKTFQQQRVPDEALKAAKGAPKNEPVIPKKDFRAEHQKLVDSMRAARKYQKYEEDKAAGKAVGPPPTLPAYELPDDDRVGCRYCGRKFASDRVAVHEKTCTAANSRAPPARKTTATRGRR